MTSPTWWPGLRRRAGIVALDLGVDTSTPAGGTHQRGTRELRAGTSFRLSWMEGEVRRCAGFRWVLTRVEVVPCWAPRDLLQPQLAPAKRRGDMILVRFAVSTCGAVMAVAALTAPAVAGPTNTRLSTVTAATAAPMRAPYPPCGSHFKFTRSSSSVKVVGTNLNAFWPGYMLVHVADQYNKSYGPYNASPYGGANFTMSTGRTSKQTFQLTLTSSDNVEIVCTDSYYA